MHRQRELDRQLVERPVGGRVQLLPEPARVAVAASLEREAAQHLAGEPQVIAAAPPRVVGQQAHHLRRVVVEVIGLVRREEIEQGHGRGEVGALDLEVDALRGRVPARHVRVGVRRAHRREVEGGEQDGIVHHLRLRDRQQLVGDLLGKRRIVDTALRERQGEDRIVARGERRRASSEPVDPTHQAARRARIAAGRVVAQVGLEAGGGAVGRRLVDVAARGEIADVEGGAGLQCVHLRACDHVVGRVAEPGVGRAVQRREGGGGVLEIARVERPDPAEVDRERLSRRRAQRRGGQDLEALAAVRLEILAGPDEGGAILVRHARRRDRRLEGRGAGRVAAAARPLAVGETGRGLRRRRDEMVAKVRPEQQRHGIGRQRRGGRGARRQPVAVEQQQEQGRPRVVAGAERGRQIAALEARVRHLDVGIAVDVRASPSRGRRERETERQRGYEDAGKRRAEGGGREGLGGAS